MRSQKIDAGGDEKQGILFTWPYNTCADLKGGGGGGGNFRKGQEVPRLPPPPLYESLVYSLDVTLMLVKGAGIN